MPEPILYLAHPEIDKKKWDASLSECANRTIYAKSWYLDIVSPGWDALATKDYSFFMPLTWRKKYGIKYLCQPPFAQQLGLFSSQPEIKSSWMDRFIRAVPPSFRYIDIFLNHGNIIGSESLSGMKAKPRITHHLSLAPSYAQVRKKYSTNLSRNLKKAMSYGWIVDEHVETRELVALFRKNRGRQIDTLGAKEYSILGQLASVANEKNEAVTYGIRSDGKLLAGALFLRSEGELIFLFSATGEEGRKTGAMSAVIDHCILEHCGGGWRLDFEGSMDKNLSRFYKSFGATEIVYLHIQINRLPEVVRWLKK